MHYCRSTWRRASKASSDPGIGSDENERRMTVVDFAPPPFTELPDIANAMMDHEGGTRGEKRTWKATQEAEGYNNWKEDFMTRLANDPRPKPL